MKHRFTAFATLAFIAACGEAPTEPTITIEVAPSFDVISQTFASGSNVTTWDPILPAAAYSNWTTSVCPSAPTPPLVGLSASWQNPHNAFVVGGHPWAGAGGSDFDAPWINSWADAASRGPGGHNWTKHETQVSGNGAFVIRLLADNCSWIYLDGTLVGYQPAGWYWNSATSNNLSYGLTLNGTHTLSFIIFDGGGAAGGKYVLKTTTNPPPPLNPDLDEDGHPNTQDAFPLDPSEWADSDGDGVGDHSDAFPNDPSRWEPVPDSDGDGVSDDADNCAAVANADQADNDGDGQGDACDADDDNDGTPDAADAYPKDPSESVDTDGDGTGNNADTDDDGDGYSDQDENDNGTNPLDAGSTPPDNDGDRISDRNDPDDDNDGVNDGNDAFPTDPGEWADSDGDGIGDNADAFDTSDTRSTLQIGTCSTGVGNRHLGNGTWWSDLIAAAKASAKNHGAFLSAVAAITDGWKKAGLITGREEGAITSCAARSK